MGKVAIEKDFFKKKVFKLHPICNQRNNNIRQNADCDAKNIPQGNKGNHKNNKQNLFLVSFEF